MAPNGPHILCVALTTACLLAGPTLADASEERRIDGNIPGGERYGAEEDTGYTGYPVDPGEPHSAYYDPSAQHRSFSPEWTGAFVGGGLLAGASWTNQRSFDNLERSLTGGLFLNYSSVQQILDLQLSWNHHRTAGTLDDNLATLDRHSLGLSILGHPLFIMMLFGDRTAYTIAQLYAMAGISADFISLNDNDGRQARIAPGWHIGAGIDTYILRPRGRSSWWIGPQWRFQRVSGTLDDPRFARQPINEHHLWLRLSWRWHGNLLTGMRGPQVP